MTEAAGMRVDKWLWHARFCKSRSLASALCEAGHLRIDGRPVGRAHATVREGQVLTFVQGGHVRLVRVLQLSVRRGPAPEARALYEDLAPPQPAMRLPRETAPGERMPGSGRPTKRERRALDRLRDGAPD